MVTLTMDGAVAAANAAEQDWREWVMRQLFVAGQYNDVLTVEQIRERVAESGVDVKAMRWNGRAMGDLVRAVSPLAATCRMTVDGKQHNCWRGIRFAS